MKRLFDVKQHEIEQVVHPKALDSYCRKLGIRSTFELSSGMYVLVVQGLPRTDSVINGVGEVRNDIPLGLRVPLNAQTGKVSNHFAKSARYQFKEPEPARSVFEQLPPLSASVVEYEKALSPTKEKKFDLAWMQVEETMPQQRLWSELFTSETPLEIQDLVRKSNEHLNDPVRQGEIVVLPTMEPTAPAHKNRFDALIEEAKAASAELAKLTQEQIATVNRHFELLDYYADEAMKKVEADGLPSDLYAYASMGVGAVAVGVEQHLKNINGVLLEINHLYVSQVAMASRVGGVSYGSFVAERASLFKKLDGSFAALSKRSIQIPVYTQIKRNLKLSTRSVIHNADEIIARGIVPNLGKRMANVAIGIATSRGVGYVGLVLGAASGAKNIYDACSVDGSGECGRITTREVAGFIGGIYGGGIMGNAAVGGTLLALGVVGVTSAPILAIASVGAFVAGGAVGGVAGSTIGKNVGDVIYIAYQWGQEQLEVIQESF
ncbi:hypothetical protein [Vibrio parahaemolyticus]|uniref:hypothetical protein n=1 Tax=Vibrio parahaemolyticus TaxID=670 RepID=UPI00215C4254|nr:hypothetical protein [Vibrio parahaemolyticus]MCR9723842.1 hypothetical protein [Vibrio parahaemolyticus]MCR9744599.1 hypothetical protein [Vibrio parahaemolyticus]MDF4285462.1 hypothetical protein [Vibrio parahaemolyticus]MEA5385600.1 hypothetical protein [Vibrio parahaemolyticus]HCH5895047.1 hypothetical protein [Vibrio parahaemolyticus]